MAGQSKLKLPAPAATTINDLPDCILIQILSLLPYTVAIGDASFISRRWRKLWHFIPTLDFYVEPESFPDPEEHLRLANSITQILLHRPNSIPFTVFRLAILYFPDHRHSSLISSWLRYALDCRIEDLSLTFYDIGNDAPKIFYQFHFSDLRNKQIKRLSLIRCEIVMPGSLTHRVDSLRVLELIGVDVADELLTNMISSCRNLEDLCLDFFEGVRSFRICSKSLKFLKLLHFYSGASREHSSLEMCTPNLSKIIVQDFYVATFTGDLSSVNEAEVIFSNVFDNSGKCWVNAMNLLSGVENLKIKGFVPSKIEFGKCYQLRRLKHLEVATGYLLDDLLGVSLLLQLFPALETLEFGILHYREEDEEDDMSDLVAFFDELGKLNQTKFHSLHEVKVQWFRNRTENLILYLLDKRRVVLNKVVLVPANLGEAPVVLDPTAGDLSNLWNKYIRDTLAKAWSAIMISRAELVEAERALSSMKEDPRVFRGG